jgi:hypothetical protein
LKFKVGQRINKGRVGQRINKGREMEIAAGKYLKVTLDKKEALCLYYRLTSYFREQDPIGFGRLMDSNDGTLKDHELMRRILEIMTRQHPEPLDKILLTLSKGAGSRLLLPHHLDTEERL